MPVATKLAIDMVFSAITPSDMKRKSEKADSFYAIPPPSPKRMRKTHRYTLSHHHISQYFLSKPKPVVVPSVIQLFF